MIKHDNLGGAVLLHVKLHNLTKTYLYLKQAWLWPSVTQPFWFDFDPFFAESLLAQIMITIQLVNYFAHTSIQQTHSFLQVHPPGPTFSSFGSASARLWPVPSFRTPPARCGHQTVANWCLCCFAKNKFPYYLCSFTCKAWCMCIIRHWDIQSRSGCSTNRSVLWDENSGGASISSYTLDRDIASTF